MSHHCYCTMDSDHEHRNCPRQPWIALESSSEIFHYDYRSLSDAVSFESTRGYVFQVNMLIALHSNCCCDRGLSPEPVLWFRPQAACEPFPLLSQDGPNEWLQDIFNFGVLDSNEKGIIVSAPTCIDCGYIDKATRISIFERLELSQWPSGYFSGRPAERQWTSN